MADLLRVSCRDCATSFVSAHQGRRGELRSDPELILEEGCPHCGATGIYRAVDYQHGALVGRCRPVVPVSDP